jgi:hypothetical protein
MAFTIVGFALIAATFFMVGRYTSQGVITRVVEKVVEKPVHCARCESSKLKDLSRYTNGVSTATHNCHDFRCAAFKLHGCHDLNCKAAHT